MAVFSVDSDALLTSTATIRATIARLEGEVNALMGQLTGLQGQWTGAASGAFQAATEQWRGTQRTVEDSLGAISASLATAGRQYADAEMASMSLFR